MDCWPLTPTCFCDSSVATGFSAHLTSGMPEDEKEVGQSKADLDSVSGKAERRRDNVLLDAFPQNKADQ